jgi:uncharacterized protein (TIGR03437 family)
LTADYPVIGGVSSLTITPTSNPPLREGSYYIGVAVLSNAAAQTGTMTATVTAGATPEPPRLAASATSLEFATSEGVNPAARTFSVRNSGGGALSFDVTTTERWLSATPSRGSSTGQAVTITVAVNVAGLSAGTYNGTIGVNGGAAGTASVAVRLQISVGTPTVGALTSVSAASLAAAASPDSIVSSFGSGLAAAVEVAPSADLPESLGDTTVTVLDSAGTERTERLFFVAPGQVNFLLSEQTALGTATVRVRRAGRVVAQGAARVQRVAPAIFTAASSGRGVAAAQVLYVALDGTQRLTPIFECAAAGNCSPIPIDPTAAEQVYVMLYGTGMRGRSSAASVSARIGTTAAEISDAVPQGQYAGLDQANLRIPRDMAGRGVVNLVVTIDGQASNTVTLQLGGAAPVPVPATMPPVPTGRVYQPVAPGLEWTYRVTFPQNVRLPHKPIVEEPEGLLCSNVFCGLQSWNAGQIEFRVVAKELVSSDGGTEVWNADVTDRGAAFYFPTTGPIQIRRRRITAGSGEEIQLELVHKPASSITLVRTLSRPSDSAVSSGVLKPETVTVAAGTFTGVITTEIVTTGDSTSGFTGTYRTELKLAPYVGIIRAVMRDANNQVLFTQELVRFTEPSAAPVPRFRISNLSFGAPYFDTTWGTTRIPFEFDFDDPGGGLSTGSYRMVFNLDNWSTGSSSGPVRDLVPGQTTGRMKTEAGFPLIQLVNGRRYTFTFVVVNSRLEESNALSGSFVR